MICQCLADQLFSEAKDTGKSRYLAITEFNNCFIIQSPSLFFIIIFSMIAQGSDLPFSYKSVVSITHEQNKTCLVFFKTINTETQLDSIAHEQTIICRSRGLLSANEKQEKHASNDNPRYHSFDCMIFSSFLLAQSKPPDLQISAYK